MTIPSMCRELWHEYLSTLRDPEMAVSSYYDTCRFGHTTANADKAAAAVLRGDKSATCSLLWEYELSGRSAPEVGSLSILLDGHFDAVAVIETTAVLIVPFSEIDASFAYDYGEGERNLEYWHNVAWGYFEEECARLGLTAGRDMPMLCEQFIVVYPSS